MSDLSIKIKALLNVDDIGDQIDAASGKIKERFKIGVEIDDKNIQSVKSQIDEIQKYCDSKKLKLGLEINNEEFNRFTKDIERITRTISDTSNIRMDTTEIDKLTESYKVLRDEQGQEALARNKTTKEYVDELGRGVKEIERLGREINDAGQIIEVTLDKELQLTTNHKKHREELAKLDKELDKIIQKEAKSGAENRIYSEKESVKYAQEYQNKLNSILGIKEKTALTDKQRFEYEQHILDEYKKQEQALFNLELYKKKLLGGSGVVGELDIFAKKNKGKYSKSELSGLREDIESLTTETPDLANKMKELELRFSSIGKQAAQSGTVVGRTLENMAKFLRFYLVGGTFVKVLNQFKQGVSFVTEFDQSLTQLNRVAKVTDERLKDVAKSAFEMANGLARTGKEVIDAAAEWKRSGYTMAESIKLAGDALKFTNIADGISDVKEASSALISILRGMKLEARDVANVMDMLVKVSDDHAISTADLTEMLKRNVGTLAQTGAELKEIMALEVAGFESLRSFETVSAGLNFITARLRGMNEEGEEIIGLIPKLQDAFDKYTDGAVSVIDKQNGGLNSTYEILRQLSEVYGDLNDEAQAFLNQQISGTRQAKVLVAIMENWKAVESSIKSAEEATGAADDANRRYVESIQGRLAKLQSSVQEMWNNAISSDFLKFVVDLGNSLIKLTDRAGFFNTAISLLITGLTIFNSKFKEFTLSIVSKAILAFRNIGAEASVTAVKIAGATVSVQAFTAALTIGLSIAIPAVVAAIKHFASATERAAEKVRNLHDEYLKHTEVLNELEEKYGDMYKRMQELYDLRLNGTITQAEKDELAHIEKTNVALKQRIEYEKELARLKGTESELEAVAQSSKKKGHETLIDRYGRDDPNLIDVLMAWGTSKTTEDAIKNYIARINDLKDQMDNLDDQYKKGDINAVQHEKQYKKLEERARYFSFALNDLKEQLEDEIGLYKGYTKEGDRAKQTIEAQLELIYDSSNAIKRITGEIDDLDDAINKTHKSQNRALMSQAELNEMFKEGSDKAKDFYSSVKDIDSVYEALNNEEQISADTISKLITLYPEYAEMIARVNDSKEDGITVAELLMKIEKEQAIAFIENERDKLTAVLHGLKEVTKAYDTLMMLDPEAALLQKSPVSDEYRSGLKGQIAALDEQLELLRKYEIGASARNKGKKEENEKAVTRAEVDELRQFNIEIERLNVLLDENQRLIDNSDKADAEKHLRDRIKLVEQQQQAYKALNDEQKRQLEIRRQELQKIGFNFDGDDITNYLQRLPQFTDDAAKSAEKLVKEFDALSKAIPETEKRIYELGKAVKENLEVSFQEYYDFLFHEMKKETDAIKRQTDEYNKLTDAKIKNLQDVIKHLESVNEQEREAEDRAKRLSDIEKQKQKIANLEEEQIKMFQNGEWTYVAHPRLVREETERLQDMQSELAKWEHDLQHKKQIDSLKKQIEYLQEEKKNYADANTERINAMNEFMNDQRDIISGANEFQIKSMEELNETLAMIDKSMYSDRLNMLESFLETYNAMMAGSPGASASSFNASVPTPNYSIGNLPGKMPESFILPNMPAINAVIPSGTVTSATGKTFNIYDFTVKSDNAMQLLNQLQMLARMGG